MQGKLKCDSEYVTLTPQEQQYLHEIFDKASVRIKNIILFFFFLQLSGLGAIKDCNGEDQSLD